MLRHLYKLCLLFVLGSSLSSVSVLHAMSASQNRNANFENMLKNNLCEAASRVAADSIQRILLAVCAQFAEWFQTVCLEEPNDQEAQRQAERISRATEGVRKLNELTGSVFAASEAIGAARKRGSQDPIVNRAITMAQNNTELAQELAEACEREIRVETAEIARTAQRRRMPKTPTLGE